MRIIHIATPCEFARLTTERLREYQLEHGGIEQEEISDCGMLRADLEGIYLLPDKHYAEEHIDFVLAGGITFYIEGNWMFVCSVFVLPEYRGKRLFSMMMMCLKELCKIEKLSGIHLSTYNFEAPHIYEHYGFVKGTVLTDYNGGNTSIDYVLYLNNNENKEER